MAISSLRCCGVKEVIGMNNATWRPLDMIKIVLRQPQWAKPPKGKRENAGHAAYVFTLAYMTDDPDPDLLARMPKMKKYIESNKLGTFTLCEPGLSGLYQSKHTIQIGVWVPDKDGVIDWALDRKYLNPKAYDEELWTRVLGRTGSFYGGEIDL